MRGSLRPVARMNDSSASATSATASSNAKKASQDAGTMLFITGPPFGDHLRLVSSLFYSAGKVRWTGMLAYAGGLCFERRTAACTLRRMAEHGNAVNKKRTDPAVCPRRWLLAVRATG